MLKKLKGLKNEKNLRPPESYQLQGKEEGVVYTV